MPALSMLIHDPLRWRAASAPDHPAIVSRDGVVTYRRLDERSNQVAHALRALGVAPGDRVALLGQNSVAFLEATFGVSKAGAVSVPLGYRSVARELRAIVTHSDARAAIVDAEYASLLTDAAGGTDLIPERTLVIGESYDRAVAAAPMTELGIAVDDAQPYAFLYTSGTTGAPKGVVQAHRGRAVHQCLCAREFDMRPDDVIVAAAPLYNSGPIFWALATLSAGATVALVQRFDPAAFDDELRRLGVTYVPLIPTLFNRWIDAGEAAGTWCDPIPTVRMLLTAGEPMLATSRAKLLARFPQAGMVEHYGSTEAGVVLFMRPADFATKAGSVGRPMFGNDVRLLRDDGSAAPDGEVGELWSRGVSQMEGYFKQPDVTAEITDGEWIASGDLATRDADGYYYIVGRKKDTIKTGGATVYPSEIEAVLMGHEAVREVAVVGVPDEQWGELVVAAVVPEPGADVSSDALAALAAASLANYKRPRAIYFVEELPKSPAGKVLKREVKQQIVERRTERS